ncbi:MAG: hypothetical protein JXA22_05305 [Candidatus Thermoplasmatota archaeon]|nr:hypothetical protein [Candidatus Thermoplasmatota archaeon]
MMLDILKAIGTGGSSINEIALEYDIDRDMLLDRISILERMGYLKKVEIDRSCETSGCGKCHMSRACVGGQDGTVVGFMLTEKGERAILDMAVSSGGAESI